MSSHATFCGFVCQDHNAPSVALFERLGYRFIKHVEVFHELVYQPLGLGLDVQKQFLQRRLYCQESAMLFGPDSFRAWRLDVLPAASKADEESPCLLLS